MSLIGLNDLMNRVVLWPAVVAVICLCAVVRAQNPPVELVFAKNQSSRLTFVASVQMGKY